MRMKGVPELMVPLGKPPLTLSDSVCTHCAYTIGFDWNARHRAVGSNSTTLAFPVGGRWRVSLEGRLTVHPWGGGIVGWRLRVMNTGTGLATTALAGATSWDRSAPALFAL